MITDTQREAFRRWSEELNKLDSEQREAEAAAWIAAALTILNGRPMKPAEFVKEENDHR